MILSYAKSKAVEQKNGSNVVAKSKGYSIYSQVYRDYTHPMNKRKVREPHERVSSSRRYRMIINEIEKNTKEKIRVSIEVMAACSSTAGLLLRTTREHGGQQKGHCTHQ